VLRYNITLKEMIEPLRHYLAFELEANGTI